MQISPLLIKPIPLELRWADSPDSQIPKDPEQRWGTEEGGGEGEGRVEGRNGNRPALFTAATQLIRPSGSPAGAPVLPSARGPSLLAPDPGRV